jgi:putative membrane protein
MGPGAGAGERVSESTTESTTGRDGDEEAERSESQEGAADGGRRGEDEGAEDRRAARDLPLHEVGEHPDPRFTFANERTFLAWNRTALALIAAGLAVAQLLRFGISGLRLVIALPLLALAALLSFVSYRRWEQNERALRLGRSIPYSNLPRLLGWAIAIVAIAAGVAALVDLLLGAPAQVP